MHDLGQTMPALRPKPVLVLGTDDVASAVGHALACVGIAALLVRDPDMPVLYRGMSFDDALEQGSVRIDGITAYAARRPRCGQPGAILGVTALPMEDLLNPALMVGVIDARMRRRRHNPDLRGRLRFAIGIGPGFTAGGNVDIAVETARGATGVILREGMTMPAREGLALFGGAGEQRFVQAPRSGIWWTFREIGELVEDGAVVGLCGGVQVHAPHGGYLRGLVRRGSGVRAGTRLLDIDPLVGTAECHGLCPRAVTIAAAALSALHEICRSPGQAEHEETVKWLM